jgi:uncharacterized membrane protein YfcA
MLISLLVGVLLGFALAKLITSVATVFVFAVLLVAFIVVAARGLRRRRHEWHYERTARRG